MSKLLKHYVRRILKEAKPTKTKEPEIIDVGDEMPTDTGLDRARKTADSETGDRERSPRFRGSRGSGPSLDSFRGHDVLSTLGSAASRAADGDFDEEFEDALRNATQSAEETGYDPDWGTEEPTDRPLTFQPNLPAVVDKPGVVKRQTPVIDAKQEVLKVLMDEFVQPAMSLGGQLLPTVYAELGRLLKKDPETFIQQFGAAVNFLREIENEWFSDLLGVQILGNRMDPPAGPQKEMHKAIINVLKKYYNAVLSVAADNADNLKGKLDAIKDQIGEEAFSRAMFEALSDTRDIEDESFGQLLSQLRRLR